MRVRSLVWAIATCSALLSFQAPPADAASAYTFDEAVHHGVVDLMVNPWAKVKYDGILDGLRKINPGLVNRLGFQYAGVTMKKLNFSGDIAKKVAEILPRARIGGGFPENLKAAYEEKLPCNSEADMRTFSRGDLTDRPVGKGEKYYWIDPSMAAAQEYYICVGKAQIRRGFDHLHFEEADNILKQSRDRRAAIAGYGHVREELLKYGAAQGVSVSFSGEPELAREIPLEAVYIPARFYEESFDQQYRNRVRTAEGKGYTYVLSAAIVDHYVGEVPHRTKVMFYIDNFDYKQDDLRRMMELDSTNRRSLIVRSAEAANARGAVFIPSLTHCDGCVPPDLVGDPCELLPDQKTTYYDAASCGDIDLIRRAMAIHDGHK